MNKKLFMVLILAICFSLSLASCQNANRSNNDNTNGNTPDNASIQQNLYVNNAKNISIVKENAVPKSVNNWFKTFGNTKGAYIYQHPYYTYAKINAGQKPTGGYGINIKKFTEAPDKKVITVEFTQPPKDSMVTTALTYPSVIIKIASNSISTYKVVTTKKESLTVKDKVIKAALELPTSNSKVTNPVRVKGKIAAFEGSFIVRVYNSAGKVIKETVLQTDGAPAWGGFDTKISYPAASGKGRIEIGEYSAKDGSYLKYASVNVRF